MKRSKLFLPGIIILVLILITVIGIQNAVARSEQADPSSKRTTTIQVSTFETKWWLVYWKNNQVACELAVDHDGIPSPQEVYDQCGKAIYAEWAATKPCENPNNSSDLTACTGLYFHELGSQAVNKTIEVDLPLPSVSLSLIGCEGSSGNDPCSGTPVLVFNGIEPLPNEQIIRIQGDIDGTPFSCPGDRCEVPLFPTGEQGIPVNFWAESSFGDATESYTAQVRMIPWGNFTNPEGTGTDRAAFFVDVISSQWAGDRTAGSCSDIWEVFPEISGPPLWLQTPKEASELKSSIPLYYLSAMLIHSGKVDASGCPNNGLDSWSTANECGVEAAAGVAEQWQNQFDDEILKAANQTGIPAQLMKNIFTRESQLWPGIYWNVDEAGLGQLTENGADTVLLWNPAFYNQFCPLVLSTNACSQGFANLTDYEQTLLRGALVQKVNAACPNCPMGIDLTQADFSINVFAQTLLANCEQVDRMLYNTTQSRTAELSSYDDLWRFTLVNYNAGPGCLASAFERTSSDGDPMDWIHVAANLDPVCRDSVSYVIAISKGNSEEIPVFNTPLPTPTITRTPTITPTPTVTPTPTITPTATTKP